MRRLPSLFSLLLLGLAAFGFFRIAIVMRHPPNHLSTEAAEVLRNAKGATLYSVDPLYIPKDYPVDPSYVQENAGREKLQRWYVLGKMVLDEKQTASAAGAFQSAIDGWDGAIGACFNPRHALRIESGGHEYDFLLCYECRQLYVYRDGKELEYLYVKGSPGVLNAMLTAAKIPLAPSHE